MQRMTRMPSQNDSSGLHGLLYSQIGYESGLPIRIVVRAHRQNYLTNDATASLLNKHDVLEEQVPISYWGKLWGSHWFVADFSGQTKAGE